MVWDQFGAVACFVASSLACVAVLESIRSDSRPLDFHLLLASALMPPSASGHTRHFLFDNLFVGRASSMIQLLYVHQQILLHPSVAMLLIFLMFGCECCVSLPFDLVGLSSRQAA